MQLGLTRKNTMYTTIGDLIKSMVFRDQFVAMYAIQWFGLAIGNKGLATFNQLKSAPIYFYQFISQHQIDQVLKRTNFQMDGDYLQYVLMIRDIWNEFKKIDIFREIGGFLCVKYNPDLDFERDFVTMLESYFYETVYVILIATLLTYMLCFNVQNIEQLLTLFGKIELSDLLYNKLYDDFEKITKIYNELMQLVDPTPKDFDCSFTFEDDDKADEKRPINKKPTFIRTNPNSGDTRAYFEIAEKVRKALEEKVDRLREQNQQLMQELEEHKMTIKIKENEIVRLTYSNKDLFQRTLTLGSTDNKLFQEQRDKEVIEMKLKLEIAQKKVKEMTREIDELKDENLKLNQFKRSSEMAALENAQSLSTLVLGSKVLDHDDFGHLGSYKRSSKFEEKALEEKKFRLDVQKILMDTELKLYQANLKITELEARNNSKVRSHQNSMTTINDNDRELECILARLNSSQFFDRIMVVIKETPVNSQSIYTTPKFDMSPSFDNIAMHFDFSDKSTTIMQAMTEILKEYEQISKEIASSLYSRTVEAEVKLRKKRDQFDKLLVDYDENLYQLEIYREDIVLNLIDKSPQIQELINFMVVQSSSNRFVMEEMLKSIINLEKENTNLKKLKLKLNSEILKERRTHQDELDFLYSVVESYIQPQDLN